MALTSSQLEYYRRILAARRAELAAETLRAESEVGDQDELGGRDPGDQANASLAKEDLLGEAGRDSRQLAQIDAALTRLQDGTYGTCAVCGQEIPKERLDAVPWATLCVRDQEMADRRRAGEFMAGGAPSRVTL